MSRQRIAVVTDSTSNLAPELRDRLGITMVPLNLQFGSESFQDQLEISTPDFMERLQSARALPTTSQPSPALFADAYRRLAADHDAILAVLLSSKLSGTIQSAQIAAETVADEIPVEIVDSLNASLGLGFQVLRALDLIGQGTSAGEIAQQLRSETAAYHLVFFVDTLEYLQRGGRIGKAASVVGGVLKLKPLLRVDEGQVVPHERTRTRGRAIEGLRDFVQGLPKVSRLGVLYSTDPGESQTLADEFAAIVPRDQIMIEQFTPVIGAHVGPGAMGVCVYEGSGS